MSDKDWLVIPCMLLIVFACMISNITGFVRGVDKVQQEAVIKGHAEWVADADGKAVFKWKEAKP